MAVASIVAVLQISLSIPVAELDTLVAIQIGDALLAIHSRVVHSGWIRQLSSTDDAKMEEVLMCWISFDSFDCIAIEQ
jgi:hypothetical protein